MATWQRFGLPILGVQTEGEVDHISSLFSGVDFMAVPSKSNTWDRPHLPRVTDMLAVCSETILLINSDIAIDDTLEQFAREWMNDDATTLVCGVRHDVDGDISILNPYGIDAFRITPEMASGLVDLGFVIGAPGWDYWLPWELWNQGFGIRAAESSLAHEVHDIGYARNAVAVAQSMLVTRYGGHRRDFTEFVQRMTGRPTRPTYKSRR